ncbi:GntR family transcriptional regulator [Longispora fulva]|uniref:DNA-binding transcriptional MocR family regulator n=1 Tax=Longispora fulva TaxID=619741 RepID=A0A8J7KXN4_9ACTN|nr:aminotransferase class I/II-fold pyridoxal phosphate-dependent enzyme [Longispora fulva]MBG6138092.1 DNA-binding transcriptional MocR family regulator [Longispora fulva]GIG60345.1 GntR family transcriptional regulator [Longispora fulva]
MPVHYQFSGDSAVSIAASVEAGIRTGALPVGAPLPPIRGLAAELGVSPATVSSAYAALRQRGVVETAGRNGTRVRDRPAVGGRAGQVLPVPENVVDLSSGAPNLDLLPRLGPVLARIAPAPVSYRDAGVLPELAAAASDRLALDGIAAEEIVVTSGALDAIERLLVAHLSPGDAVGVEDPGWANLLDLAAAMGLRIVPVPVDEAGPTLDGLAAALAAGVRALVVTSRAHNPTGAALTPERSAALRVLLAAHADVLVIEDDHCGDLDDVPLHALAGVTPAWAYIRSVSKAYGPDLRLAVVAGDAATLGRVSGRLRLGAGWVSTVLQHAVLELWGSGPAAVAVREASAVYRARRAQLLTALSHRGLDGYGRSGINVWLPVPDETTAVARLRDAGWAVAAGAAYRQLSPPAVRITISGLADAQVAPLADAILTAVTPTSGRRSV